MNCTFLKDKKIRQLFLYCLEDPMKLHVIEYASCNLKVTRAISVTVAIKVKRAHFCP